MSLIIEQTFFAYLLQKTLEDHVLSSAETSLKEPQSAKQVKEGQQVCPKQDQPIQTPRNTVTYLQHYSIQSNLSLTLKRDLTYHKTSSHLYYTLHLIINQQKYIKIFNRERRLSLFKTIFQKMAMKKHQNSVLGLSHDSGFVKFILFNGCLILDNDQRHILNVIMHKFYKFQEIKEDLIDVLAAFVPIQSFQKIENKRQNHHIRNIQNYMCKIGSGLRISCNNKAESSILQTEAQWKQKKQKILQNLSNPTSTELLQLSLFCKDTTLPKRSNLLFLQQQLSSISAKIKPPTLLKCSNLFENNCILNYIKINNPEQLRLTRIASGGFSSVFFTEIQYWYVYSGNQNEVIAPNSEATFSRENMFKKAVIFKKEENKPSESRSRELHQKAILKQIKNGNALFVPKYYIPLNEPATNRTLFCDYISNPNLSQYMRLHRETLSPASKVLILLMLAQGIRFLSDYEVFHLDLKPHNVMITKSMMVKIIDFGESYHHSICNDNFIPGFTMPYGAPESFYPIDRNSFSFKNDVFSLGIIANQLMNNRLPFYFYDEDKHFEKYTESNFEDFWYYAPEECEDRGDPFTLKFMQLVIGRCMDVRADRRPDLDWLCLIFREFFDFYY